MTRQVNLRVGPRPVFLGSDDPRSQRAAGLARELLAVKFFNDQGRKESTILNEIANDADNVVLSVATLACLNHMAATLVHLLAIETRSSTDDTIKDLLSTMAWQNRTF